MDQPLRVRARLLGDRIDVRQFERNDVIADGPLTVRTGREGHAFLFRFGVVVFSGVDPIEEADFVRKLAPFVTSPTEDPQSEHVDVIANPDQGDRLDSGGVLHLHRIDIPRLQLVAETLAKSVVLAHHEEQVAGVFDRVEDLAERLSRGARPRRGKELLEAIGRTILIQARTVGRVEITEKPEQTWDVPELDRLYERLAAEFELRERDRALLRKLDLISRTAETYLELVTNRRSIRLEWYIVILIIVEIVLTLYEMFIRH